MTTYTIRVSRTARIGTTGWAHEWSGGTALSADWTGQFATADFTTRGSEFIPNTSTPVGARTISSIYINFGIAATLTRIEADTIWDVGCNANLTYPVSFNEYPDSNNIIKRWTKNQIGISFPGTATNFWENLAGASHDQIRVLGGSNVGNDTTNTGATLRIKLEGLGTKPTFNGGTNLGDSSAAIYGDAFYYSDDGWKTAQAYSGQGGINVDGSGISAPDYNAAHVYEFTVTGTGNPFTFSFVDTVDSDLTNNENKALKVEVIL